MQTGIEWNRYTVVHWKTAQISGSENAPLKGWTRAFAQLTQAVVFVKTLDPERQQTARVDCGGQSYHILDINHLAGRADFPHAHQLVAA
ncbi:hypothetical protein [Methylobacterium durans]|uniref:hypothetical protein n=1 Tax=Methylobacterium durans TaxID=2202825 RepID=UPI0013A5AC09|nr:hypothetical protein [Methylobacterium durans]